MYKKFLEIKVDDYDEDLINLIGKYTENCLRLVAVKPDGSPLIVKEDLPEDLKEHQYYGIPLLFELMMDETHLNSRLSQKVLEWFTHIISKVAGPEIYD